MITITKSGKEKAFYAKCDNCASDLEYYLSDVNFTSNPAGRIYSSKTIRCPECGNFVCVSLLTRKEYEEKSKSGYSVCSF